MDIQSAVYFDSQQSSVIVTTDDGRTLSVPVTESNRHYRQLLESGVPISPYVDPRTPGQRWDHDHAAELAALADIDKRTTPRMIREAIITGEAAAIQALESEAAAIRATLPPRPQSPPGQQSAGKPK